MRVLHKQHPDRNDAVLFLTHYGKPGTQLATDGSSIYHGIEKWHPVIHDYERHAKWEFSKTAEGEGLSGSLSDLYSENVPSRHKPKTGILSNRVLP